MQSAIKALLNLGPLPSSAMATESSLRTVEEYMAKIQSPLTDDEARALVKLFGPDDCFGLAWTLVHLIETAPSWPIEDALDGLEGGWAEVLRERAAGQ